MDKKPDRETVGYCLDSIIGNLEFIEKRLQEMREALPHDQEFPKDLNELAEQAERRFQKVNNLMIGLPFPRI